jgi:hypothetical protein
MKLPRRSFLHLAAGAADSNSQQSCGTYGPVCGKQATLLGDADESHRMGGNRPTGWNVKGPAIRAWGKYHSRVIGSTGGQYGPLEGATAEKAVPFPCAAR